MYGEFKLVDSEYIDNNMELYANNLIYVMADFNLDIIKIAKRQTFDRWSNCGIIISNVPYTTLEYDEFELLLCEMTAKILGKSILISTNQHKKLTFI